MEVKHQAILRRHCSKLRDDLEVKKLLPNLFDVLDPEDEEEVKAETTRRDMVDKLLQILPMKGPAAFDIFVKELQKIQPFLAALLPQESETGEEIKTELKLARTHSAKLRQEVDLMRTGLEKEQQKHKKTLNELEELTKSLQRELLMAKGEDDIQIIKTIVQELENITKRLGEELSTEKCDQEARKMCDQMDEDLRVLKESFEKISEEHRELFEKLSHYKNHVTNETSNHTGEMRLISSQEEIVILDRIPNGLEFDDTVARLHDQATSPGEPIHFKFEGNQTCSRCHDLKKKLDAVRTEMKTEHEIKITQLQLKHNEEMQTLEREKNDMETKIEITRLKIIESTQLIKELQQQIVNLRKEKNEIELQLCDEKAEKEKELTNTKKMLVKAVRRKDYLKKVNTDSSQLIEKLNQDKEKLIKEKKALQSKLNTEGNETRECVQIKAERNRLSSETELLRKEVNEWHLKCKELQEKIIKSKNFVSRVFLPSGKDFYNCSGVICALKREVSAKPIATRSSDGPGEASDIFNHRIGTTSGTKEMKGSWWCIDLGKNYLLVITHYALKHGRSDGESILRHWQLEGSIDGISWKKLETCKRDNPNDPPQFRDPYPFVTGTWSVEDKAGAFRFFRILQTGRHSSGKYGIYLSGVELYGILLDV